MGKHRWLSAKELRLLSSQEGPLQGAPIFEDLWAAERIVGAEFIAWVERAQLGTFVYWVERWPEDRLGTYWRDGLCELAELMKASDSDFLAAFIDALPQARAKEVVAQLRALLKTTGKEPKPAPAPPAFDKHLARRAALARRALVDLHHQPSKQRREHLAALEGTLGGLGLPKDEARARAMLDAEPLDAQAVYAFAWGLELPVAEPVVHELRRWLRHVGALGPREVAIFERRWRPLLTPLHEDFKADARAALAAAGGQRLHLE